MFSALEGDHVAGQGGELGGQGREDRLLALVDGCGERVRRRRERA